MNFRSLIAIFLSVFQVNNKIAATFIKILVSIKATGVAHTITNKNGHNGINHRLKEHQA